MRQVSVTDFGKNPLRPDNIDGDAVVLTIKSVEETLFDNRKQLEIRFEEFPDHQYFTNVSIVGVFIAMLGNDLDKWAGQRVPLEKISVPLPRDQTIGGQLVRKGTMMPKLYPVDVAEWNNTIAENDKAKAAVTKGRKGK